MDNSVSVFSTLAAISIIAILAVKCVQDNYEQYEFATDEDMMYRHLGDAKSYLDTSKPNKLSGAPLHDGEDSSKQPGQGECSLMNVGGVNSDLAASSLLPKVNNLWDTDVCVPNALTNEALLSPLDRIGANTVNRNMSHDIRGDLFCQPRINFPINNSSIECNSLVRPLSCFEGLERPAMYTCKGDF